MTPKLVILGSFIFVLCGCAKTAHLYPVNDVATATGVLDANYVALGTGHVELTTRMPDGEVLKGEATVVRGGTIGFGAIYASVYGPRGAASGLANTSTYAVPGGSPGMADLFGNKGTSMQCEFYNDNFSGHGYGGCRSSKGGLYRLQY